MSGEDLNVGDRVVLIYADGFSADRRAVVPVVRLTKTRVTVLHHGRETQFRRRGFMDEIGTSGYRRPHIQVATPKMIAEVEEENARRSLIARIRAAKLEALSTDRLRAALATLTGEDA